MTLPKTEHNLKLYKLPYLGFTSYLLAYGLFATKFEFQILEGNRKVKIIKISLFLVLMVLYITCIELFYWLIKSEGFKTQLRANFFFAFPFIPSLLIFYLCCFLTHTKFLKPKPLKHKIMSAIGMPLVTM